MHAILERPTKRLKAAGAVFAVAKNDDVKRSLLWPALSARDRAIVGGMAKALDPSSHGQIVESFLADGARRAFAVAIGERSRWSVHRLLPTIRSVIERAKGAKLQGLALALPDWAVPGMEETHLARLLVENARLASYEYTAYRGKRKGASRRFRTLTLVADRSTPALTKALREGQVVGEALDACRDFANTPGGDLTPTKLAEGIRALCAPRGVSVSILRRKELERLGMGGVLGVARGSSEEPTFTILEYRRGLGKPVVLVGKGVTFDSGGLNVKPGDHMSDMHLDMSGAAAVAAAITAAARLKLAVPVIGLIPAVENMPSGSGYRPGDVLRTVSGTTIEVINTDAEGRIILADALGYAARLRPRLAVDVATLTGAAAAALGPWIIALLTPDEEFHAPLRSIGEATGDFVWPMPLWEEYEEEVRGTFGDLRNSGKHREAGMITAASFLREFTKGYPWVHLDIAPTMVSAEGQHLPKGASGTGVRFLIELLHRIAHGTFDLRKGPR